MTVASGGNQGVSGVVEGIHPRSTWYDRPAQWLTRRVPRLAARAVIRVHRTAVRDRLVVVEADGINVTVSPQDNCGGRLFYYGQYEPSAVALWQSWLRRLEARVVVDVGANLGLYTLLAAAGPSVERVIAFEPNESVLPLLRHSVTVNPDLAAKITVVAAAAGAEPGTVRFYRNHEAHNLGLGSLTPQTDDERAFEVPVVRVDHQLRTLDVDRADLIKIDVEGAETMALRGMRDLLSGPKRPALVVEVHPNYLPDLGSSVEEVLTLLRDARYDLQLLNDDGTTEPVGDRTDRIAWVLAEPAD